MVLLKLGANLVSDKAQGFQYLFFYTNWTLNAYKTFVCLILSVMLELSSLIIVNQSVKPSKAYEKKYGHFRFFVKLLHLKTYVNLSNCFFDIFNL